jgi:uncharacterized RDD family membrane protein YckC
VPDKIATRWGGQPTSGIACKVWTMGIDSGITAQLTWVLERGGSGNSRWTRSRNLPVPLDAQLKPITPWTPQAPLGIVLLIAGSALWLRASGGRTPGKWLLGLRVLRRDTRRRWLWREVLRLWPLFLNSLLTLNLSLMIDIIGIPSFTLIAATVVVEFAVVLAYYALPLIRWRGQMHYDRICGTTVTRD